MSKRTAQSLPEGPELKISKIDNDDRLILRQSPITLKEMATVKIAVSVWYHENLRRFTEFNTRINRKKTKGLACLDANVKRSIKELPIPVVVSKVIENYVIPIRKELATWVTYVKKTILFHLDESIVYSYLDEIAWRLNGTVHHRLTAKRLLSSPRLSEIEKFRVMCTFCLEDEIKNVSTLLFTNIYIQRLPFEEHPLICYWNAVMTGKLDKLAAGFASAEVRLIMSGNVDNECAIEYFLDRLSDEDKVNKTKYLIQRYDVKYQTILLNGLNEVQQQHVFMDLAPQIIKNYALEKGQSEFALSTWIHIRYLVTENQFFQIFKAILTVIEWEPPIDHIFLLIAKIWENAAEKLRRYVLNHEDGLIAKILSRVRSPIDQQYEVITIILSDASPDYKRSVILSSSCLKLCQEMVLNSRPFLLNQLLKMCLPDADDAMKFRKDLMATTIVRNHCAFFLKNKTIGELNEFYSSFLSDAQTIDNLRGEILKFSRIDIFTNRLERAECSSCFHDEDRIVFITDMLAMASDEVRKDVLDSPNGLALCEFFILKSDYFLLDFVVKLCIIPNEIVAFKRKVMNRQMIQNYCLDLYEKGEWQKMNKCLILHLPDTEVGDYKASLLMTYSGINIVLRKLSSSCKIICTFLSEMLQSASLNTKKTLLELPCCSKLMESLIIRWHPATLNYLVELCLPEDEGVKFKKSLTLTKYMEAYFLVLWENKNFHRIEEFKNLFFSEAPDAIDYVLRFMNSTQGIGSCMENMTPKNNKYLNRDINEMLRDVDIANEFKKKFIMSDVVVQRFQEWIAVGLCNEVSNCVNNFLPDGTDLKNVKDKIFDLCRAKDFKNLFAMNVEQRQELLSWFFDGDAEQIRKFKSEKPHHKFFDKI